MIKKVLNKKGFTLIELLVAIAIIGVLVTLTVISLQTSRRGTRDAKRISDINQIQIALENYHRDFNEYPATITPNIATGNIIYLSNTPSAPYPPDGSCSVAENVYTYTATSSSYTLNFCLGGKVSNLTSGKKLATPSGIVTPPTPPWACGDVLVDSRDSQEYPTVLIGTQCWMAKNLAYLPSVQNNATFVSSGNSSQPAYSVYGYDGSDVSTAKALANYTTYGVLYNWFAAVATSSTTGTEGLQGACPTGWHIPTFAEQTTMYNTINSNTAYLCNAVPDRVGKAMAANEGWITHTTICNVGNNQQTNNSTGLNIPPAGSRSRTDGSFSYISYSAYLWSSTFSNPVAFSRSLNWISNTLSSSNGYPASGFSVRCLKN